MPIRSRWIIIGLAVLGLLFGAWGARTFAARPAPDTAGTPNRPPPNVRVLTNPTVATAIKSDTSPPLRDIRPVPPVYNMTIPSPENPPLPLLPNYQGPDAVLRSALVPNVMPTPIANFEGQINYWGVVPPDTSGDVGPNHYLQTVNSGFQIYSKTGTSLYGPASINTIWTGFGGPCETRNDGDPVPLHDQLADRWLVSQFTSAAPYGECIAISTGPDPLGSWYRYFFLTSQTVFGDYPHLGVWPDAYYMTVNQFGGGTGGGNYAFERDRMLVGDPAARFIYFNTPSLGGGLPSDFDGGTLPPAGSPNFFLFPINPAAGTINLYRFHVDWVNTANSTFTGPFAVTGVTPWDGDLCTAAREACVPQPNTAQQLEAISDRFMFRLAYRNMGAYEALVANQTVDADAAGRAGMRWYEIRSPNGTPAVFQSGTYAPADGQHRWMGSIAMDRMGNIAAGFSISSGSTYPSINYAGRLVSDPPGQFAQGEATMFAGTGSQSISARWGDYSQMAIDPRDDCTFWYTTEYYRISGGPNWRTRIGSFRFPSCVGGTSTPVPSATAVLPPTNTPPATATLCPGAVTVTGSITNTDPGQQLAVVSGPNAVCGVAGTCTMSGIPGVRHYDSYTYTNSTGSPQCVTVRINALGCGESGVGSVAYLGSFDPNNVCTNYLAHAGQPGPVYSYSFTVAAGATYIVVVRELSPSIGCTSYTMSVSPCTAGGGGTATATPATSPTRTATPAATATPAPCGVQPNWVAGPTLTPDRNSFGGGVANDGKFYVAGGQMANNTPIANANRYNPATNAWETIAPMPGPAGQVAVGAEAGKVYVAGGYLGGTAITSTLRIYDIAGNSWSFGASLPASVEAAAGVTLNGKFYVIGGDDFTNSVRSTYIYDIATNTWTTGPQLPDTNGRTNTAATTANGKVYVWGGVYISGANVTIDTMLSYDPATSTWTTLASANSGGLGNFGGVSPYGAGKLLVTAGGAANFNGTTTTYIYDIASNTYAAGPLMAVARQGHAQGTLPDGRVIVASGLTTSTTNTSSVELLGPVVQCVTPSPTPAVSPTRTTVPTVTPGGATPTSTPCTIQFTDVDQNNPFYSFIRCLACRLIVSGYSDGTFRWGNNVTRGQLSKIISGAAGQTNAIPSSQQTFEDVPNSNVFWLFIERLSGVGAISGYNCGGPGEPCGPGNRPYFRWGNNATRGQISKITAVTAGWNGPIPTTQQSFEDVPITNPFWTWIEELASRQIISGYNCGGPGEPCGPGNRPYFRWGNNATRGQMSKIAAESFFPGCQTPQRK